MSTSLAIAAERFLTATAWVSKANPTPADWRALRRIVSKAEPELRRTFLRAIAAVQNETQIAVVRELLEAGNLDAAAEAVPWKKLGEPKLRNEFARGLRDVYEKSGSKAASLIHEEATFSIVDPRAQEFIARVGGKRIVEISENTRLGIRQSLETMMQEGLSAQRAAALIRPQIGLFGGWADAVTNYRAKVEGFIADGAMSEAEGLADVSRYANQLRQARALMIARTEATDAQIAATFDAAAAAAEEGLFDPSTAEWKWDASPAACDLCAALDGVSAPYGEPAWEVQHTNGTTETISGPTVHPNCTCSVTLLLP